MKAFIKIGVRKLKKLMYIILYCTCKRTRGKLKVEKRTEHLYMSSNGLNRKKIESYCRQMVYMSKKYVVSEHIRSIDYVVKGFRTKFCV